ncbi:sulfonate transport system ATP-binding protein [Anaerolineae bacterium]|nr:sulfonate transport system ATP-binding protein [Anaerolineae bacterium]
MNDIPVNLKAMIEARGLTKVYKMGTTEVRALNGVSLDVFQSEMVSVIGQSGSGKSTLLSILGALDLPTSGSYKLDGREVATMRDDELAALRNQRIGFVFQKFNLLARSTALANVELPLTYAGVPSRQSRKRAAETLTLVGLGDRLDHKPNELSGGQQQRVAIARALVNNPSIILADEPTGNLDSRTGEEILELFHKLHEEQKITLIVVTHDPKIAAQCQRVIKLRDGVVVPDDDTRPLMTYEALRNATLSEHSDSH